MRPILIGKNSIAAAALRVHFGDESAAAEKEKTPPLTPHCEASHLWKIGKGGDILHESAFALETFMAEWMQTLSFSERDKPPNGWLLLR